VSALVIGFQAEGESETVGQLFERGRKELIDRYGSPGRRVDEGDFSPSFVIDVNAQWLIRVMERVATPAYCVSVYRGATTGR
jgi:hypothetical protein